MSAITRWDPLAVGRWDPLKELEEMQTRLFSLFGRGAPRKQSEKEESLTMAEWAPLVDVSEDEKEYLIKAELPEVKKEDIKVSVHDDVLTMSGERKYEQAEKGKKYHRVERAYGSFMRTFTLPEDADGTKVTAEFKDGILRIHLPKSEKAKPKSVEIKVG